MTIPGNPSSSQSTGPENNSEACTTTSLSVEPLWGGVLSAVSVTALCRPVVGDRDFPGSVSDGFELRRPLRPVPEEDTGWALWGQGPQALLQSAYSWHPSWTGHNRSAKDSAMGKSDKMQANLQFESRNAHKMRSEGASTPAETVEDGLKHEANPDA
ncbi:hypothetical protein NDU88_000711 [Pleurodeles waltl]|uniref:Uncharacterized protein n=1 Tax=Pleurodeles waltl TaxID=8319 RepID=A0AAV7MJN3_PLEWA|nr:hypothetical protein NDU88_000711 [Pleurodeles waltl]